MIRDYDRITPEQERAETVIFGEWWDWFFEKYDISQDTAFELEIGSRTLAQFKAMYMADFPLQESALTYLPGVALSTDRNDLLAFLRGVMNDFALIGFLK